MDKQFAVPALAAVEFVGADIVAAIDARDNAESAAHRAMLKAQSAILSVTDLLEADGWKAEYFAAPKKDVADTVVKVGDKSGTLKAIWADVKQLAVCQIDKKLKADTEPCKRGLKWSKQVKQYHIRTATLPKEVNDSLTQDEKDRRKELRQEIGAYVGAFKRDLGTREAQHKATLDPTGQASAEGARGAHHKRDKTTIAVEKVNWVIKVAQDSDSEIKRPTEVVKAAKELLKLLS